MWDQPTQKTARNGVAYLAKTDKYQTWAQEFTEHDQPNARSANSPRMQLSRAWLQKVVHTKEDNHKAQLFFVHAPNATHSIREGKLEATLCLRGFRTDDDCPPIISCSERVPPGNIGHCEHAYAKNIKMIKPTYPKSSSNYSTGKPIAEISLKTWDVEEHNMVPTSVHFDIDE